MKTHRVIVNLLLLAVLLAATRVSAQDSFPIYRFWKNMYGSVDKEMGLNLNTGAFVRGRAVAIRPGEIEVEVKKTSDPQAYPKKRIVIPRSEVEEVELYEYVDRRTSEDSRQIANAGRTAGTGVGGSLGARMGGLSGAVIGGVLGNLAGVIGSVAIRRRGSATREEVIRIRILPDDGKLEGIPPEIQASGDELMRERHAYDRVPLQLLQ